METNQDPADKRERAGTRKREAKGDQRGPKGLTGTNRLFCERRQTAKTDTKGDREEKRQTSETDGRDRREPDTNQQETNEDEGDGLGDGLDLHLINAIHGQHEHRKDARHRVHLLPPPRVSHLGTRLAARLPTPTHSRQRGGRRVANKG
jgi:hypothetical protein